MTMTTLDRHYPLDADERQRLTERALPTVAALTEPFRAVFDELAALDLTGRELANGLFYGEFVAETAVWLAVRREVAEIMTTIAGRCALEADRAAVEQAMRMIVDTVTGVESVASMYHGEHYDNARINA